MMKAAELITVRHATSRAMETELAQRNQIVRKREDEVLEIVHRTI